MPVAAMGACVELVLRAEHTVVNCMSSALRLLLGKL
jgi:hypothetical protein